MPRRPLLLSLLASSILCLAFCSAGGRSEPARDPLTGRVRILYVGDCFGTRSFPYVCMTREPLFVVTPIPSSTGRERVEEEVRKLMRLYMPRTYSEHLAKNDLVLLSAMELFYFRADQLVWFKKGVLEEGDAIVMIGGYHTFGGKPPSPSWSGTSVEDVLPVNIIDSEVWEIAAYLPVPVDPGDEFCSSLDWSKPRPFYGMNIVTLKQSAREVLRRSTGPRHPLLVYWEVGKGSGVAHTPDWAPGWGEDFTKWSYFADYVNNLMYYAARLAVPQDLELLHAVRSTLFNQQQERGVIQSLANFVESFGGNADPIQRELGKIAGMEAEAYRLYADQDYQAVMVKMDEVSRAVGEIKVKAIDLKNRTFIWVFAIEWLVVTGTLMVAGYALWTLMVGRRLYREVAGTRLSSVSDGREGELAGSGHDLAVVKR